jgi:hypothetical protein
LLNALGFLSNVGAQILLFGLTFPDACTGALVTYPAKLFGVGGHSVDPRAECHRQSHGAVYRLDAPLYLDRYQRVSQFAQQEQRFHGAFHALAIPCWRGALAGQPLEFGPARFARVCVDVNRAVVRSQDLDEVGFEAIEPLV